MNFFTTRPSLADQAYQPLLEAQPPEQSAQKPCDLHMPLPFTKQSGLVATQYKGVTALVNVNQDANTTSILTEQYLKNIQNLSQPLQKLATEYQKRYQESSNKDLSTLYTQKDKDAALANIANRTQAIFSGSGIFTINDTQYSASLKDFYVSVIGLGTLSNDAELKKQTNTLIEKMNGLTPLIKTSQRVFSATKYHENTLAAIETVFKAGYYDCSAHNTLAEFKKVRDDYVNPAKKLNWSNGNVKNIPNISRQEIEQQLDQKGFGSLKQDWQELSNSLITNLEMQLTQPTKDAAITQEAVDSLKYIHSIFLADNWLQRNE